MPVPLFSSETVVSALLVGAAASLAAAAAISSARRLANLLRRLTPMQMAVVLTAVGIATASAQKSVTNGVDVVAGTNEVGGVVLNAPQPMFNGGALLGGCGAMGTSRPTIAAYDIGRGYRLDSVSTNDAIAYEMPDDATEVGTWRLTGAYDDVVNVGLGDFRFPLGTNLCSSLWAHTWGTARPSLRSVSNELAAVGAPMSAIPDASRFWTARTTNGTFLLTWRDFALGRTSSPIPHPSSLVSAQLELFRNGDFIARSNDVESVYRRVNPDDWDGDGWLNEADDDPYAFDADGFGPHQDYPGNLNTNHHYWVELVVSNADALVEFVGDRPSDLPDPKFIAKAGETNRVHLLIGKRYDIRCAMPVCCVDREDADVETWGGERDLTVLWPVRMDYAPHTPLLLMGPRLGSPSGNGVSPILTPSRVRGGSFVWENSFCCCTSAADGTPIFDCNGTCGCAGRCSTGLITYMYSGYSLSFGGWSCNCPVDEHSDDEPEHEAGPSVSARFSTKAVIFEDAYENEPGVTMPRRSTDVEVEFYVYGGTNGGTYAFALVNGAKLLQVDGGTLPVTGHVAAGESRMVTARYEGRAASDEEGDIIAKAEFVEFGTGQRLTDMDATLTAVKMKVYSSFEAIENPCRYRRKYGIAEYINCRTEPEGCARWTVAGEGRFENEDLFICPLADTTCELTASMSGVELKTSITVIRPMGIMCPEAQMLDYATQKNVAGGFGMRLQGICLLPKTVSFGNLYVEETPAETGTHWGYFDDLMFADCWNHNYAHGAGLWTKVYYDNTLRAVDQVTCGAVPSPWANGGMVWSIPMGYHTNNVPLGTLPLGDLPLDVKSVYTIMQSGKVIISKLGHWVSRDTNDVIVVDGILRKGEE